MKRLLPTLSLVLSLSPIVGLSGGCVVAAAAGAGYLISQEVLPNEVHTARVRDDAEEVFDVAKETLGFLIEPGTEVRATASPRTTTGTVDGATVTVTVEAYDLDHTIVSVQAERPLRRDGTTAQEVLDAILERLAG